ncbi:MAG: UDP-N-acetylmuramate--L-alanine ligase [Mangrovibacterium sp.]
MTGLEQIKQVYFLGIGGIGMSALARWFHQAGFSVSGYDRTESSLTRTLVAEGIDIHYEDLPGLVEKKLNVRETLVVCTPAVPAGLGELVWLKQNGFSVRKRSEVLGLICSRYHTCAVAGTHGKTTVSTMLAHMLQSSGIGCTAFLGGISKNYGSNLLVSPSSPWAVAEADEFDRSFLQLTPALAVITSMDADHLDIYGNYRAVQEAFQAFACRLKPEGSLVWKKGLPMNRERLPIRRTYTYALKGPADFYAEGLRLENEAYCFDLRCPGVRIREVRMSYPGLHNVENAVAAASLAWLAGVKSEVIRRALAGYRGVKRRFDIRYRSRNFLLIDDYAHHPEELKATIGAVRSMFPGRKVTGIFQPHLYSRTRDFAVEFAAQLSRLDRLLLLDIYPAREKPLPGISSALILEKVEHGQKQLVGKKELAEAVGRLNPGVILMMGAGDIENLVQPVSEQLKRMDEWIEFES